MRRDSLNYETTFGLRPSETNVPQPLLELDWLAAFRDNFMEKVLDVLYPAHLCTGLGPEAIGSYLAFPFELLRTDLPNLRQLPNMCCTEEPL